LFRALHEPLLQYAARLTRDDEAAYDVVQEAFIRLWEHRESLDSDRSLRAYLYTIVRNTAFTHMEQRKRERARREPLTAPAATSTPTIEDTLAARELRAHVRAWVEDLPPRRQEAFRLSRFDGLSHEEIAHVMGLAQRTVTHHIMLALRELRDRLATYQTT
jgi:RNA polymerase sigma-70 factor (ECF subfamily)